MKNLFIQTNNNLKEALIKISKNLTKGLIVVDKNNKLLGILNDGDIRRALLKKANLKNKVKSYYKDLSKIFYVQDTDLNFFYVKIKILEKNLFLVPVVNEKKIVVNIITHRGIEFSTRKQIYYI